VALTPVVQLYDASTNDLLTEIKIPPVKLDVSSKKVTAELFDPDEDMTELTGFFETPFTPSESLETETRTEDRFDDSTDSESSHGLNTSRPRMFSEHEDEAGPSTEPKVSLSKSDCKRQKDNFDAVTTYCRMTIFNPELPYHAKKVAEGINQKQLNVGWLITAEKLKEIHEKNKGIMFLDNFDRKIKYEINPKYGNKDREAYDGIPMRLPGKMFCTFRENPEEDATTCGQVFDSFWQLRKHWQDDHHKGHVQKDTAACVMCAATYPREKQQDDKNKSKADKRRQKCLVKHLPFKMIELGRKKVIFHCPLCIKKDVIIGFTTILLYRDHLAGEHKTEYPDIYVCGVCGKSFTKDYSRQGCQKTCMEKDVPFTCVLCPDKPSWGSAMEKVKHFENTHHRMMHYCFLANLQAKTPAEPASADVPQILLKRNKRTDELACPFDQKRCKYKVIVEVANGQENWEALWPHMLQSHDEDRRIHFVKKYIPASQKHKFNPYEQTN